MLYIVQVDTVLVLYSGTSVRLDDSSTVRNAHIQCELGRSANGGST